jgi:polysaccharide biosynthesis protein PslH
MVGPSSSPRRTGTTASPERRRLLFLVPFSPRHDATHGGGRSLAQLLVRLGARHDVALLALRADDDPPVDDAVRAECQLVEEYVRSVSRTFGERWSRRFRLLAALARGRPMWVADTFVPEYARRAREVAQSWQPDIVQIEFHVMGQYASAVSVACAPLVLTQYEPGAQAADDWWRWVRGPEKLIRYVDALSWKRFERRMLREVDAVVAFTERDRSSVAKLGQNGITALIPVRTDVPRQPLSAVGSGPPSIVFIGNFMHPPNVDAALRLITQIFPVVARRHPGLLLYVVGDGPPADIRRCRSEQVVVTGRVPDVTPYLDRAAVVAVPIRFGGGIRIKVLEALAAGKAVVASSRALEGLNVVDGEHVVIAETDREFADALGKMLSDEDLRTAIAARARAWARANAGWEKSIEAYEALYESLLRRGASSTGTPAL